MDCCSLNPDGGVGYMTDRAARRHELSVAGGGGIGRRSLNNWIKNSFALII
jgi:hypothetical protein